MSLQYVQSFNRGGTPSQYERLLRLCRQSNAFGQSTYGLDFLDICENRAEHLDELDLQRLVVNGDYIPGLRGGTNDYSNYAASKLNLSENIHEGLPVDMMLVIPEVPRMVSGPRNDVGIGTVLTSDSKAGEAPIVDAIGCLRGNHDIGGLIRMFDSHPSTAFYFLCANEIMAFLGYVPKHYEVVLDVREYKCDLGLRFVDAPCQSMFVRESHGVQNLSRREIRFNAWHILHVNPSAPIDKKILLLGDSHSFSGLAPLLACIFSEVRFIWACRRDGYRPFNDIVPQYSEEADHIIEEVTERFFMANFCTKI